MILDFTSRFALLSRENLFFFAWSSFIFPFSQKFLLYEAQKRFFHLQQTHTVMAQKKLFIFWCPCECNILKTKYIFLPFEEEISTIEIDLAYLCVIIIRTKQLLQRIHYELSKSNLYHFMSFSPKRKYFYDVNKKVFILKKITTTKSERQLL